MQADGLLRQISQSDRLQIVVDDLIQLDPHRKGGAAVGSLAVIAAVTAQTGHRGQGTLGQLQDAADGIFLRFPVQTVTAALAMHSIQKHKEKIIERKKQYYEENKEKLLEYYKQYREEHKEEILKNQKKY